MVRVLRWLALMTMALIVAGASSAVAVWRLEENNAFCAACHLPLEVEYVRRAAEATADAVPDLASWHHVQEGLNCVACHRGDQSPAQRAASLSLGAINTVKYIAGSRGVHEGATRQRWLTEASCLHCHQEAVDAPGFENHLHNELAAFNQIEAVQNNPAHRIYCDDCHLSHREAEQALGFVNEPVVITVCDHCHVTWERGPRGLR